MSEKFFSELDSAALCALASRTALRDAALITVSATLHIENHNEAAARLTGLHPLERLDQLLSENAASALRVCIERKLAQTLHEELDGVEYRLELVPHREGALVAFLRRGRTQYDGTLRALHTRSAQHLGSILACASQVTDGELSEVLRRNCLRIHRMLNHSDFLHDAPLLEQLRLQYIDLAALCREAAEQASMRGPTRGKTPILVQAPQECRALVEAYLVRNAVYNLLSNAMRADPSMHELTITLRDDGTFYTITVADRGAGLDPALFEELLTGWERPLPLTAYLALVRQGVAPGLGLPLVQRVAQLHGGSLLLSPRAGGGSELHLSLSHLPDMLAEQNLYAPVILEDSFSLEEVEFSIF